MGGWNIGCIDGYHDTWAVIDDVGFIEKAKNFALAQYAIAGNVTYAIGFSMGANMIFQLMCVASSQYSGFAAVGSIGPYMHGVKVGTVQGAEARSAATGVVGYSETCDPTPAKP